MYCDAWLKPFPKNVYSLLIILPFRLCTVVVFFIETLCGQALAAPPLNWQPLAKGLNYANILLQTKPYFAYVHAFRIDLKYYLIHLAMAQDYDRDNASLRFLASQTNALIAINGGFFSPDSKPLGLRIQNGILKNQIKNTSWWGIFFIEKNQPVIVSQNQFNYRQPINFAVQGGPRLVVSGQIPKLKEGIDARSAICVTKDKQVILASTQYIDLTTTEFAQLLQKPQAQGGLGCLDALNLDGGHSSQLYASIGSFYLYVPNFSLLTDAIVVLPR